MTSLRKQISKLGVYARLYQDFNNLLSEMQACLEMRGDADKEVRKMAEEDMVSVQEQMDEL